MKKDYMEPQFITRAYLQNVTITTDETDEDLASTSLGDNETELEW